MALIPLYFVVADHLEVAATYNNAAVEILEGQFVKIDPVGGKIIPCDTAGELPYGVAGDTKSTSVSGLPSINDANLSNGDDMQGTANTRPFVNRVSDSFDETKASGRITVYHSGGKFATNQYEPIPNGVAYAPGLPLYVSANGLLDTAAGAGNIVATCVSVPAAYPSGVPGVDVLGSISLGDYLVFKLTR